MKLNDSLIKNRELWKDKTEKRESYKQMMNLDKKNTDFFLKEDSMSKEQNLSQNLIKSQNFFEVAKTYVELKSKSFKNKNSFQNKLEEEEEEKEGEPPFDPEVPSADFFEEKGSESIIEKNDEDSKFVDEESSSVVYLTRQQMSSGIRVPIKQFSYGVSQNEGNTKELSKIEDVESSTGQNDENSIIQSKEETSKEQIQNSINSISNINSPNFKIDSMIGDSEIKDTKKIINEIKIMGEGENSEGMAFLFSEEDLK